MNRNGSIAATKAVHKVKVADEYKNKTVKQNETNYLLENAKRGIDSFEALYKDIEECYKNQVVKFDGSHIFYYPELNIIMANQEAARMDIHAYSNDEILKEYLVSKKLSKYSKRIELLNENEVTKIFKDYKKTNRVANYTQILCIDENKELLCWTIYNKKAVVCKLEDYDAGMKSALFSMYNSNFNELNIKNNISTVRVPVCVRLPKKISRLEMSLKYDLKESQLSELDLYENLKKLISEKYVEIKNGKAVLTKAGLEAVSKKKIKQIGTVNICETININKENQRESINLKKLDIEERKNIFADYLKCDKYRANMREYDLKCLEDPNMGHWELWETNNIPGMTPLAADNSVYARNPVADIRQDSVVGIDFGTKSTVVVYQDGSGNIKPMPIGCGDTRKELTTQDFENPTVMQFIDFKSFMKSYNDKMGRPYTRWRDITVSHAASESMKDTAIRSDEYYSYMYDLKQWAGEGNQKKVIHDKSGKDILLNEYENIVDKKEGSIDPIEIYAYYIGLYINNMNNGIYLDYILSFPVTYEKKIRDAILKSFSAGLKKSLPESILKNKDVMKKFNVEAGTSEPAAYAICALEKYGFEPEEDEKIFYGIFDFGGGTADFDFGLWTASENEDVYDYCIEHFGQEGDRYLGGENLLQLIAFEVFKENIEICRENSITFGKPNEFTNVPVELEGYINESQEARMNLKIMMEKLRPFWERKESNSGDKTNPGKKCEDKLKMNFSEFQCGLFSAEGEYRPNLSLTADTTKLEKILRDRIEKGVRQFFNALKETFSEKYFVKTAKVEKINIFLAGNSSKSPILKEVFERNINEWSKKILKDSSEKEELFKLYPPLGSDEAKKIQKENKIFEDELEAPTGKTGVAWGLIEGRKGGRIEIKEEITYETEAKFAYYLGISVRKKFKTKIARDADYNKWYKFIPALKAKFEINYTSLPEATNGKLSEKDDSVMRKRLEIDKCGDNLFVYIRLKARDTIEYALGDIDGKIDKDTIKQVVL